MNNNYLEMAKETIIEWFVDRNAKDGHVIRDQDFIRLRNDVQNPKVADLLGEAVTLLEEDGVVEQIDTELGKHYALSQKGYDYIYSESDANYLTQAKEKIMIFYQQRKSKVGDVLTEQDIIRLKNGKLSPKVADSLSKAFSELVSEGMIEIKNIDIGVCYALTLKGYDAIY